MYASKPQLSKPYLKVKTGENESTEKVKKGENLPPNRVLQQWRRWPIPNTHSK